MFNHLSSCLEGGNGDKILIQNIPKMMQIYKAYYEIHISVNIQLILNTKPPLS